MTSVGKRLKAFVTAALATAALASLCAAPAMAQAKDQLVVGQLQFLTNFHPLVQVNNTKRLVINYALRPITAFDENVVNNCILCETLPTIENGLAKIVNLPDGKKGMKVTLKLRQGLAWGDGVPVTSKDIQFTWKMAQDPKIGFSNYNSWTRASEVEVVDDRTVTLTLPRVMSSYNSWDQVIPEHLEGPVYAANPTLDGYVKQSLYNTQPTNPGLWNGSFLLSDYQIGTRIVFTPNPKWPGEKPHLQRIVLSYRDNSSALLQNLLAGSVEAVPVSPGGISFSQMLDLKNQQPDKFTYHLAYGTNVERIAVNFDNPILKEKSVRQAILYAIDRQAISDELFGGLQPVANGIVSTENAYYNKDMTLYSYDAEKSKELLESAGWKPGSDGICVNDKGDRLSLELVSTSGNQTREQIAQVIQSQLKEVCIEITNNFVPLQEFNGEMARKRKFKALMMSSIDFSPSVSPRIALGSDAIPKPENNGVGNNFSAYASPAMDKAITDLEAALDPQTTKEKWAEVQKIFSDDLPMLPLYFYPRAYVTVTDLANFRQGTLDPLQIWSEEWQRQ
ncbi:MULTISPECIES: peptide ABC transporter substrate-binding protein [Rhizobium]|uniref:Peptide ABC transporter substrate-binding protein n=1 Tax=Rhizobium leguminosarum bv. viciae TaxID=387 RepID=A0A8G2MPC2_RHILV|nr:MULTISPECIES: peptide ABC transporter substrate-binding protein [Rhizobium]MBB4510513.1 peptide/nickel transport system substrate-binding protein [Rhizobium leguminosarum]NKK11546.1 peptide ABC transporter substrate-binding protein [Rhizobium leguminosarum bv. viciae]NKK25538.1 peptide ABC transporter substrate-binding protein [Rhizobium leguminosarum bv. viciae]TBD82730.1 peptide ABC transporter substrate-binding protein [Rhizobium ruizarguesonis]TBE13887.1 peptide ABC transporter substrat